MTQRIGYYFHLTRKDVLGGLSLSEFYDYHNNCIYFYLESQGKPQKKPSNEQKKVFETERMAALKKLYGE